MTDRQRPPGAIYFDPEGRAHRDGVLDTEHRDAATTPMAAHGSWGAPYSIVHDPTQSPERLALGLLDELAAAVEAAAVLLGPAVAAGLDADTRLGHGDPRRSGRGRIDDLRRLVVDLADARDLHCARADAASTERDRLTAEVDHAQRAYDDARLTLVEKLADRDREHERDVTYYDELIKLHEAELRRMGRRIFGDARSAGATIRQHRIKAYEAATTQEDTDR